MPASDGEVKTSSIDPEGGVFHQIAAQVVNHPTPPGVGGPSNVVRIYLLMNCALDIPLAGSRFKGNIKDGYDGGEILFFLDESLKLSNILESRGVILDIDPVPVLQRDGYYALINGYKDPFLDKKAMQSSDDDRYIPGTKLSDIYGLFLFDRELREALFPYLAHAESTVRTVVVESFCSKHQEVDSYLERNNYVDERWMLFPKHFRGDKCKAHRKGLNGLIKMFESKTQLSSNTPTYVQHYLERYGYVPLWVLQNNLTFGNVKHFYQLLERDVQAHSSRTIQELSAKPQDRLEPQDLLQAIEVLVDYRNICAHNDRLYCAKPRGRDFGEMFHSLWKVLPASEIFAFLGTINSVARKHPAILGSRIILEIANSMGAILKPY